MMMVTAETVAQSTDHGDIYQTRTKGGRTMTGYYDVDVIIEGALDESRTFEDTEEDVVKLDRFIADTRLWAKGSDERPWTEVYIQYHDHPLDEDECVCVQYETDHHPDYAWNIPEEGV